METRKQVVLSGRRTGFFVNKQILYYNPKDIKSKKLYDIILANNLQNFFRYISVLDKQIPYYIKEIPAIEINPVKKSKEIFVGQAAEQYVTLQRKMGTVRDPVPHDSYKCVPMAESGQRQYNNYVR